MSPALRTVPNLTATEAPEHRLHIGDAAASFTLQRELFPVQVVARLTIMGEPVSKSRARFTNRGSKTRAYTPEKTRQAEDAVGWAFRVAAPGHRVDADGTFGVMGLFFAATRQRRDVDNMLKLILDGLTGVAWSDDVQVTEVSGRRGEDLPQNARTEVLIYRVGAMHKPTRPCDHCGKPMPTYPSWDEQTNRYCSRSCRAEVERQNRTRACNVCGAPINDALKRRRCDTCRGVRVTVDVDCSECGKSYTVYQSQAPKSPGQCSPECRAAYAARRREFCVNGHRWTTETTYQRPNGSRVCRACAKSGQQP